MSTRMRAGEQVKQAWERVFSQLKGADIAYAIEAVAALVLLERAAAV